VAWRSVGAGCRNGILGSELDREVVKHGVNVVFHVDADFAAVAKIEVHCKVVMEVTASLFYFTEMAVHGVLVAFSFFTFLHGGAPKGEGKSNVLGIPLFLLLFLFLAFLLEVPKGTLNLRKIEGKGKAG